MQIEKLQPESTRSLIALYRTVTVSLRRDGVKQWDWFYPNRFVIAGDVKLGYAFGIADGDAVVGAVTVNRTFSPKYEAIDWTDASGTPAAIHRLAVRPDRQGQGLGGALLRFAENRAKASGCTSIRLDVYSGNPAAVAMYEKAGYRSVGTVRYPMRKQPYFVMEKLLG